MSELTYCKNCEDCEYYHQNDPDYPYGCEYPDSPPCNESNKDMC